MHQLCSNHLKKNESNRCGYHVHFIVWCTTELTKLLYIDIFALLKKVDNSVEITSFTNTQILSWVCMNNLFQVINLYFIVESYFFKTFLSNKKMVKSIVTLSLVFKTILSNLQLSYSTILEALTLLSQIWKRNLAFYFFHKEKISFVTQSCYVGVSKIGENTHTYEHVCHTIDGWT